MSSTRPPGPGSLLNEQVAYYRARAPEYDEWWLREGRYDRGPEATARWRVEVAEVERALDAFGPVGDVLELAGGTGWWTERLARRAGTLTVVDASPEALAINRARRGRPRPGLPRRGRPLRVAAGCALRRGVLQLLAQPRARRPL